VPAGGARPSRLIGGSIFRQLGRKGQREKSGKYRAVIGAQINSERRILFPDDTRRRCRPIWRSEAGVGIEFA
jgi:hypothetical protein